MKGLLRAQWILLIATVLVLVFQGIAQAQLAAPLSTNPEADGPILPTASIRPSAIPGFFGLSAYVETDDDGAKYYGGINLFVAAVQDQVQLYESGSSI
jgi:hypothetical protein